MAGWIVGSIASSVGLILINKVSGGHINSLCTVQLHNIQIMSDHYEDIRLHVGYDAYSDALYVNCTWNGTWSLHGLS